MIALQIGLAWIALAVIVGILNYCLSVVNGDTASDGGCMVHPAFDGPPKAVGQEVEMERARTAGLRQ